MGVYDLGVRLLQDLRGALSGAEKFQDFRVRGVDDASVFYYRGLKNYHYYFGGPVL